MASNFFQRWSSRALTAKEKASAALPDSNETAVENELDTPVIDTLIENRVENAVDTDVELNQVSSPDVTGHEVDDSRDDEVLTIADADGVTFDSGVASFLQHGVDKSVKKAALAKLFHSDEFNYISDMDDHTEDFSNIPKLDDSVAKQLRGWVNKVFDESEVEAEQEIALEQDMELAETDSVELIIAAETPAVSDKTAEPVMEDCDSSSYIDELNNKQQQQSET